MGGASRWTDFCGDDGLQKPTVTMATLLLYLVYAPPARQLARRLGVLDPGMQDVCTDASRMAVASDSPGPSIFELEVGAWATASRTQFQ